ncbi:NAD(P) transhydrogenase subunit alpha [Halopseudomonas sabulinigri]|uniref:proton-translocating NAD(P)(+) transhydrogenase n=1 Tax=Halopseudomonas sabulinigri TaxID=472181 RepID=A0A1H1M5X8_9GAMM|nr:NAD(P) transhydrogenase subunit alpha [Halopseudomonas sabulinigri]SDR82156.1 NAD(P) transhydrogenase subunit alpha [Halopseudomonas sabulinigri]
MSIPLYIPRETREHEKRVALVPSVAAKLQKLGLDISLESGAGNAARIPDTAYTDAGVTLGTGEGAKLIFRVQPPSVEDVAQMAEGSILFSFIYAQREPAVVKALQERKITCFAMELVPRITRAQAMDALSSQAALAGYYAALLAATNLNRILPMMTTAVGSLRPAKVLVMGAGVAGLQALATAKRLGAMIEGYDVRPEVKEQVQSVGGKFVDTGVNAVGEGGYARELTDEEKQQVEAVLTRHIQQADAVITTASIPGKPSPKIITESQIMGMKSGAIIIDLAAEGGGNTPLTKPGETVEAGPATIVAPLNITSNLAEHASELYSRNLLALVSLMVEEGELKLDWEDEVLAKSVLTHEGEIRNEAARAAVAEQA